MPRTIVSDRDSRFVSSFWQEFMSRLGCQTLMSTAYHPQTDGQTERSNRILEEMIRCYCDEFTDTWDEHLDVLEFAYNNSYISEQHQEHSILLEPRETSRTTNYDGSWTGGRSHDGCQPTHTEHGDSTICRQALLGSGSGQTSRLCEYQEESIASQGWR